MKKYFYCYSYPLKEFLIQNNQDVVMCSRNTSTNKTFWVFENGEEITKLLNEWRLRKKQVSF